MGSSINLSVTRTATRQSYREETRPEYCVVNFDREARGCGEMPGFKTSMLVNCALVLLFICVISTQSFVTRSSIAATSAPHHVDSPSRRVPAVFAKNNKITPGSNGDFESMDDYRKAIVGVLNEYSTNNGKFGGRELLELMIKKWGAAYDLQLRKAAPFGEASGNIYVNVMWRYFGQKSFPYVDEREYLEHLEAIARYITAMDRVALFKDQVKECRKRPNGYFGYAVPFPLNVPPESADDFFKDLKYE